MPQLYVLAIERQKKKVEKEQSLAYLACSVQYGQVELTICYFSGQKIQRSGRRKKTMESTAQARTTKLRQQSDTVSTLYIVLLK